MKKLLFFATALLVLAGCNKKDNALNNAPEGTPFQKGQQVTLTVGTGTQQGPNKVAGVDAGTQIDFTWEVGDKILVKVGEATAEFTLISGEGTADGEFAGEMPAAGSSFDIQYPIEESALSAQVYTTTKTIPADKMLFTATDCTLGELATLTAQYAMVQLNLFGTDKTVGMIIFKNITVEPAVSYTLTCIDGKTIGTTSTAATPFYIIVPAGEYQFEAEIWDNAATPAKICSFATSAAQTFTAGECLNMPAKEVADPYNGHDYVDLGLSVKWATCNVGATNPEDYGDYFAWGATEPYYDMPAANPLTWTGKPSGYAWQSYCGKSSFTEWSPVPYDNNILKPEYDAAAANWKGAWRMPTAVEFNELLSNCDKSWTTEGGVSGYKFASKTNSDNYIFLPAAGSFNGTSNNTAGSNGNYWSSSLYATTPSYGRYLNFSSGVGNVYFGEYYRYYGWSVRPVCE